MFEDWKIKRKAKKDAKEADKLEKRADVMVESNDIRTEASQKKVAVKGRLSSEEWYSRHLDKAELNRNIHEANQFLYVQRDRLLRRMINFNREYKAVMEKPNTPVKERELARCSTGAKNAAYALAVVEDALRRLDNINSEYEWQEIMRDLTKGYKTVNAISIGSDLITRLAFLVQKTKLNMKGDISVNAMEHYYGKSIDKLLEEEHVDGTAAQLLVMDNALALDDEDKIMDAISWGSIYSVPPQEFSSTAKEVNDVAMKSSAVQPVFNDGKSINSVTDIDLSSAMDNIPTTMR